MKKPKRKSQPVLAWGIYFGKRLIMAYPATKTNTRKYLLSLGWKIVRRVEIREVKK